MKICIAHTKPTKGIAHTKPTKGNVSANIEAHKNFIDLALIFNVEAIFFH